MAAGPATRNSTRRIVALGVLVWISMVAVDFFLHAGLLARLYAQPSPFLLSPEGAFALIPVGYLSFALLAGLVVWLAVALNIAGAGSGFWLGLRVGVLIWGALGLGLVSISTAPPALLLGWFAGQAVEMGIGGAVAGYGLRATRLKPLALRVGLLVVASIVLTIVLQTLGLAPAARIR